jgi:hypothetical protein
VSDQVNVGDYSLEISGDEVLVRDESGAIIDTVELDEIDGELTLPDGQKIDLASVLADNGIDAFQTAAGPANDNLGATNGGPAIFQPFQGDGSGFDGLNSAGTLNDTALAFGAGDSPKSADLEANEVLARSSFDWARHDPSDANQPGPSDNAGGRPNSTSGNQPSDDGDDVVTPPTDEQQPPANDDQDEDPITPPTDEQPPADDDQDEDPVTPPTDEQQPPADDNQDEDPVTPPTDEQQPPANDDQDEDPVTPPTDEQQPPADDDQGDEPVTPPTDEQQPPADDNQDEDPVTPPTDEQQPPANDDQGDEPVTPPTDEQQPPADDDQGDEPVTPPTDEQQPPANDGQDEDSVTPPTDEQQPPADDDQGDEPVTPPTDEQQPPANDDQPVNDPQPEAVNAAPTDIDLSGNSLVENVEGAVIGRLTAIDPDTIDTHSFEVSDNRFEIVNGQLKLKDGISIDFESEPNLDVTVVAADSAGNKIQETFTLSVGNVNEAQTGLSLDNSSVAENAAGAIIGALTVSDPDAGDEQSFSVSDGRFEVVNDQLRLKSGVSLDHEQGSSISVTVTATDAGNHQYSETFTVNVSDVNEAPTGIQLSNLGVNENAAGAIIGTLTTSDPDAGDTFSYQVSDNRFQVVNGQLQLKSGVSLDHETEPTVNLKVTSTDSAGHSIQQSFTVNVANVNEAPTVTATGGTFHSPSLQPTVDFSDVDSSTLSQTVIHTTGFQSGDILNVPASSLFNVTINHSTADYTITIVGKTGNETVDQYEDFANSISFSTSSNTAGARHIDYSVTDSGGSTSNISVADVTVNSHSELYTSQLGNGQTALGAGDDVVHIDTKSFSPIDMGGGDDTVHLAQQNRSFDHQDAVKLGGVETIDTTGYGANNVSLSIHDVLNMTDGDNHLTIVGDKGDTVTLSGTGNSQWAVVESNAEFTTYAYSDPSMQAVVEISNQLNAQVS